MRRAIDALPEDRWDTLLFDTPPTLGIVVTSVLTAADEVIVPVEARPMGLAGMSRFLNTAARVQRKHNRTLDAPRLVISRTNHTGVSKSVEAEVRARYGEWVFSTSIPERIAIARSSGLRLPVSLHEPNGPATRVYRELARAVAALTPRQTITRRTPTPHSLPSSPQFPAGACIGLCIQVA